MSKTNQLEDFVLSFTQVGAADPAFPSVGK
jgi:hypothetical protein